MKLRAENVTEESGQTDAFAFLTPADIEVGLSGVANVIVASSGVVSKQVTSAGVTAIYVIVPLSGPLCREETDRGMKIASIALSYKIATAAGTAIDGKVYKMALPADGAASSATEVASTKDIADASCYDADEHLVTWTITTPVFIADDEEWYLLVDLTPANTTALDVYGALVKFTRAL